MGQEQSHSDVGTPRHGINWLWGIGFVTAGVIGLLLDRASPHAASIGVSGIALGFASIADDILAAHPASSKHRLASRIALISVVLGSAAVTEIILGNR
jgi:hypothetical protein